MHGWLVALVLSAGLAWPGRAPSQPVRAPSLPAPCVAAAREVAWPAGFEPGPSLRDQAERYRRAWRDACAEPGRYPLAAVLAQADALSQALGALPAIAELEPDDGLVERLAQVETFVPAMRWNCCEGTGFPVDLEAFAAAAGVGTAEDRGFLPAYVALWGGPSWTPPYVEQTWDYGGCMRYGDYDWPGALDRMTRLHAVASSPAYRERLDGFARGLLADGFVPAASRQAACACTDAGREAFADTLRALAASLAGGPYRDYRQGVDDALRRWREGRLQVASEQRAHCSGG